MAQVYTTGPAEFYVGIGPAITFLGTTVGQPHIEQQPRYRPVHNDYAGGVIPLDQMYMGQEALVQGTFNRIKQRAYDLLRTYIGQPGVSGTPGADKQGDRGTLMLLEGQSYPLYVRFPFAAKAAMNPGAADGNLPVGRRYLAAVLVAPEGLDIGLAPETLHLTWYCQPVFTPGTAGGSFVLYDENLAGLPVPD